MSETLTLAVILIPCLIVAIVFHEVAHGWTALMLGDPTAKERNRLSLNPLQHVDPVGTILVPGALALASGPIFGWAKPVPVIKDRLDNPRYGMMAVAAAGPGTNFVLAFIGAVLLGVMVPDQAGMMQTDSGMSLIVDGAGKTVLLQTGLFYFILIKVFLGVFNLLPIPPFDGSHILEGLLPRSVVGYYEKLRPFGMVMLMGLVAVTWFAPELGVLEKTIGAPVGWALDQYLSIVNAIAG